MSDKQAAWAFGRIFEALAEEPITEADRAYALRFFDLAMGFDFGPVDMDADEACLALGLAVEGEDPDYPGEELVLYPSCNGYEAAKAAQNNVTPIEANLPHAVGEVVCGDCNHRAVSVRPVGVEPLECPKCGEMAMREEPVNHALLPEYRRELEEWCPRQPAPSGRHTWSKQHMRQVKYQRMENPPELTCCHCGKHKEASGD